MDSRFGHASLILIQLCLFKRIRIPVGFNVIDGVLSGISWEFLTIFGSKLIVDTLLRHVHHIAILLSFCKRIAIFGRH